MIGRIFIDVQQNSDSIMATLTANTLFHFTGKVSPKKTRADVKGYLLNILETGFRPRYNSEFEEESMGGLLRNIHIPMVCFCDLPMSLLDNHIDNYGRFGLGMSKEWGERVRLNPVTYVNGNSFLLEAARRAVDTLFNLNNEFIQEYYRLMPQNSVAYSSSITVGDNGQIIEKVDQPDNPGIQFMTAHRRMSITTSAAADALAVLAYLKPYKDFTSKKLYYNEREWRYTIPYTPHTDRDAPMLFERDGRLIPLFTGQDKGLGKDAYEAVIAQKYMLKFEPDDIKYIIVESDSDISDIVRKLRDINAKDSSRYTNEQVDRLTSRIITYDQIKEDF